MCTLVLVTNQGSTIYSYIELHYMAYMLHLLQYKYCIQIDHLSCLSFLGIWIGVLFLHMIIYILAQWGQSWCMIKGCMVYQYCFDVKPFNLAACFIMKCDTKCYDYVHQNGRPLTAVYNNVQALVMFAWHTMSVMIGKKSFICGRRAKLNRQS